MVKQLQKQKVISSDNEEPSFPPSSQRQASNSIIDSPSTSTKASFLQAHAESNKGLKGKSRSSSYKHTFKKEGDPLEKGHHGHPKTLDFHIAWIIFLPYGVDMPSLNEDLDLSEPTLANLFPVICQSIALTSAQLSRLEAAGLAHSNFHLYFQFNWEWTWPQVDSMLHSEFLQLFEVLDTHPKVANPNYNTSGMVGRQYKYLPPYLLCLCSHKEIVVAGGAEFPDGEVLFQKVKAGKWPSRDESEIILVTHNEIPLKLITQWIKKQHLKGKGKHKAETDSSAEETESQLWPKSDNGDNTDEQILSPISYCLKRHPIHVRSEALNTDSEQAGPLHAGPTLASMNAGPETINLTDGEMDTTPVNDKVSPVLPDVPPTTPPLTPIQTTNQPAPSSSFTIDTSLMNPWKGNHTFQF
ncbi:hypothetical protein EDD16DRAFT_1712448 [Pisolithus croceorrhizus]|nr:hypothetical protein EDD16DRAFT_1712448 [Pisolithus croceorrhizus]KAI6113940.1 hypothetical protein EV401DRAFT_2074207 [Pisolithus croceorrhizus]KAI6143880.1 hypothetical protein EDD17DRAFT_1768626 [Pisolithus thermaeus]